MIVALARKLIALWKYVTAGVVIEGAAIKTLAPGAPLTPIFRGLISPGGSRRTNRRTAWPEKPSKKGLVLLSPPAASGMVVQPNRAATECEVELDWERSRSCKGLDLRSKTDAGDRRMT